MTQQLRSWYTCRPHLFIIAITIQIIYDSLIIAYWACNNSHPAWFFCLEDEIKMTSIICTKLVENLFYESVQWAWINKWADFLHNCLLVNYHLYILHPSLCALSDNVSKVVPLILAQCGIKLDLLMM